MKGVMRVTDKAYKAKVVLKEYRQLDKEITEKGERIQHLLDSATRATSSMEAERISGTGEHSRLESAMIRKIDLEKQLDSKIDELRRRNYEIQNAIDAMTDARERRLLCLRYLEGKSWNSVMTRMELTERNSFLIHESALFHFAEIFF